MEETVLDKPNDFGIDKDEYLMRIAPDLGILDYAEAEMARGNYHGGLFSDDISKLGNFHRAIVRSSGPLSDLKAPNRHLEYDNGDHIYVIISKTGGIYASYANGATAIIVGF